MLGINEVQEIPGVRKDIEKAFELYKESSDKGDDLAWNYLGAYYYNQKNDKAKAVDCFKQSIKLNPSCQKSLNNLGLCF